MDATGPGLGSSACRCFLFSSAFTSPVMGQRMGPLQMKTFPSSFGIRLIQSLVRLLLLAGREQMWRGRRRGAEVEDTPDLDLGPYNI